MRRELLPDSPGAGLVWVFRERGRPADGADAAAPIVPREGEGGGWFLHGLYA